MLCTVVMVVMAVMLVMGSIRYDGWRKWKGTRGRTDGIRWKGRNGGGRMGEFCFSIPLPGSYTQVMFFFRLCPQYH
jgi:hypothetical protein